MPRNVKRLQIATAPPTTKLPTSDHRRDEDSRSRGRCIRQRASPGGLQGKPRPWFSLEPKGRHSATPLPRPQGRPTACAGPCGPSPGTGGERRRRAGRERRERPARTLGEGRPAAWAGLRGTGGQLGSPPARLATPVPAARPQRPGAGSLPRSHAPALVPTRARPHPHPQPQPRPVPPATGPRAASARFRQGYEVHREEDERATVEEREDEHHRLHPPARPLLRSNRLECPNPPPP